MLATSLFNVEVKRTGHAHCFRRFGPAGIEVDWGFKDISCLSAPKVCEW